MLAPFFILFLGFFLYPFFYSLYLSLYVTRMGQNQFVGLLNYKLALQDSAFWSSMGTVVYYGILQAVSVLLLGLILALLLDSSLVKGKSFFRLIYFLPYAVPGVIAALMWGFLYSPDLDPILKVFNIFNGGKSVNLLAPGGLIYSIVNIVTWEAAGYNMTLYFAGLTALPLELYEAAKIDGCNEFQIAWRIKIPLLRPVIIFTSILSIIGSLQLFNEPFILSSMTAIPTNYTPNMDIYNMAFSFSNFNYSATLSFMLAFVTFIASLIFLYFTSGEKRRERKLLRLEAKRAKLAQTYGGISANQHEGGSF